MDIFGDERRGQTGVLGAILLFAIVLVVSASVIVVGGAAIQQSQATTSIESATLGMTELDSAVSGGGTAAPSRTLEMPHIDGEPSRTEPTAGNVKVSVDDGDGSMDTVVNESLGRVIAEKDGMKVAYQAGGVWRTSDGGKGSVMVSPPNFEYRYRNGEPTLTLPFVFVRGSAQAESVQLKHVNFESQFSELTNPIASDGSIKVEIESEFYRAWGRMFERRTASVDYDHGAETVIITLDGDGEYSFVGGGITGAISTTEDVTEFSVPNDVSFSSYDSRSGSSRSVGAPMYIRGDWSNKEHGTVDGDLVVEGTIDDIVTANDDSWEVTGRTIVGGNLFVKGSPRFGDDLHVNQNLDASTSNSCGGGGNGPKHIDIHGDLFVGGDITCFNKGHVRGDLHANGELDASSSAVTVDGDIYVADPSESSWGGPIDGTDPEAPISSEIPSMTSVSGMIDAKENELANDNRNNPTVDNLERESSRPCVSWNGGPCELTSGDYYLDDGLTLGGQGELILNTTGGAINLYTGPNSAGNGIELGSGAGIVVKGKNPVRIYNEGEFVNKGGGSGGGIQTAPMINNNPSSPEPNATNFWLYMHPDQSIEFQNNPGPFVGVICAPGAADTRGKLTTSQHLPVYGAVIADIGGTGNHVEVNFDEAILDSAETCGGTGNGIGGGDGSGGDSIAYFSLSTSTIEIQES